MRFRDLRKTWKPIRKTMFCDNAKVRWENIINTVEMIHSEGNSGNDVKKTKKTIRIFTIARCNFATVAKRGNPLGI